MSRGRPLGFRNRSGVETGLARHGEIWRADVLHREDRPRAESHQPGNLCDLPRREFRGLPENPPRPRRAVAVRQFGGRSVWTAFRYFKVFATRMAAAATTTAA